jgi:hypothetical protein
MCIRDSVGSEMCIRDRSLLFAVTLNSFQGLTYNGAMLSS